MFTSFDILLTVIGTLDIFKTLNTGIFVEGSIDTNRELIREKYFRQEFLTDFVCTLIFPLNYIFTPDQDRILLIYLLRIH